MAAEPLAERIAYWRAEGAPGLVGRASAKPKPIVTVDEGTGEKRKETPVVGEEGPWRGRVVGRQIERSEGIDAEVQRVSVTVNPALTAVPASQSERG